MMRNPPFDMYQNGTVNIEQGSFSRYRFHISCIIQYEYLGHITILKFQKAYDIAYPMYD